MATHEMPPPYMPSNDLNNPPGLQSYQSLNHDLPVQNETTPLNPKEKGPSKRPAVLTVFTILMTAYMSFHFIFGPCSDIALQRGELQAEKEKWYHRLNQEHEQLQGEKEDWYNQLRLERAKLQGELRFERGKLQGEKEEWYRQLNQEREKENRRAEQWQREEEGRQRLGLFWDEPKAEDHCLAFGAREYWALLRNTVPYEYNWLKPCKELPAVIQGKSRTTDRCEIKADGSGAVYGHWVVNDVKCTPFWSDFKDKGCTAPGSRLHKYEDRLEDIPDGEDWMKICSTAPHNFLGQHFDHPHSCMNWGQHGIYANWEIEDGNC